MENNRESFKSKFGVIAAAAGSAIGLGNIYRFPCVVGENGGSAFFIIYLIIVLFLGLPLIVSEFVIGRRAQKSPVGAFKKLAPDKKGWSLIGYIGVIGAFLILSFYTTVAAWTLDSVYRALTNAYDGKDLATIQTDFNGLLNNTWRTIIFEAIFMFITAYIIIRGIEKGIEKYSKILMPVLFVILIVLCVKSVTLPGAGDGLSFFLKPDFSKITGRVIVQALGQAFFSLSIGMGVLITYGSYIAKNDNLASSSLMVALFDTLIATLAGIIIFPAAFSFGIKPEAGASLAFTTLPMIFQQMNGGYFFCLIFFILLAIAALTSSISLLEAPVAYFKDELKMSRKKATIITAVLVFGLCIISGLSLQDDSPLKLFGMSIFNALDAFTANILMTVGGLLTVIFLGWKVRKSDFNDEFTNGGSVNMKLKNIFYFIIKFIAPLAIATILVSQLLK